MNRSTRTLVVVGIAVVVAGLASLGAYRAIQRMPVREVEVRSLYQVVAVTDLAMGSMITKDYVKLVAWPASSPVANGFTSVESVLNRGLISSVVANEPLTESKLAPLEAGAGLPPSITAGMRAVSVKVNEVIGVAGFGQFNFIGENSSPAVINDALQAIVEGLRAIAARSPTPPPPPPE